MQLGIAVVDDLEVDCKHIEDYIDRYFAERRTTSVKVTRFRSAEAFLKGYLKGGFQIIFLDICMGEISGLELAKRLRTGDKEIHIVFMSSTRDFVFETFPVMPQGYLCKPFEYPAFAEIMDRILAFYTLKEKVITLRLPRTEVTVGVSEIVSVTSNDHLSEVQLITGMTYSCRMPFKEFEKALENEPCFLICNRGVLVNMDYAVKAKDGKIVMQNGMEFPIRQRDCKSITAIFTKYTTDRLRRSFLL